MLSLRINSPRTWAIMGGKVLNIRLMSLTSILFKSSKVISDSLFTDPLTLSPRSTIHAPYPKGIFRRISSLSMVDSHGQLLNTIGLGYIRESQHRYG